MVPLLLVCLLMILKLPAGVIHRIRMMFGRNLALPAAFLLILPPLLMGSGEIPVRACHLTPPPTPKWRAHTEPCCSGGGNPEGFHIPPHFMNVSCACRRNLRHVSVGSGGTREIHQQSRSGTSLRGAAAAAELPDVARAPAFSW